MIASVKGHVDVVRLLTDRGADVNQTTNVSRMRSILFSCFKLLAFPPCLISSMINLIIGGGFVMPTPMSSNS